MCEYMFIYRKITAFGGYSVFYKTVIFLSKDKHVLHSIWRNSLPNKLF